MPQFSTNSTRYDPYKNFKFRVKIEGQSDYIAGVSKVGGLKRTTEVVTHREGGDASSPRHSPGQSKYEPITLERGVTHDTTFEDWANRVWNYKNAQAAPDKRTKEVGLKNFRQNIVIDVYNEAGQKAISYKVYRCWVSEYQALPELDANGNAIAIQSIQLQNEGWERDTDVKEPTEEEIKP
jgi:phage tail-like protein